MERELLERLYCEKLNRELGAYKASMLEREKEDSASLQHQIQEKTRQMEELAQRERKLKEMAELLHNKSRRLEDLSRQMEEMENLRKQLAQTTDPAKQMEITTKLGAGEKALAEAEGKLRAQYAIKPKSDYVIETAKSKLYLILTPEEILKIEAQNKLQSANK